MITFKIRRRYGYVTALLTETEGDKKRLTMFLQGLLTPYKVAYIEFIVVKRDLRGSGYGSQLLSDMIDKVRGAGYSEVYLLAMPDMIGLRRKLHKFYRKHGFELMRWYDGDAVFRKTL